MNREREVHIYIKREQGYIQGKHWIFIQRARYIQETRVIMYTESWVCTGDTSCTCMHTESDAYSGTTRYRAV